MKIEGIENIDNYRYVKPILGFILNNYKEDDVYIDELESHIIKINDDTYAIYSEYEEGEILNEYNQDLFDNLVVEVPEKWRYYINRDKWVDENGAESFEDYLRDLLYDYSDIEYTDCIDGYTFYALS